MMKSYVIDVGGTFAGAAVTSEQGFRFIAVDPRVEDLDQTEWLSLAEVNRVVAHLMRTGQLPAARAAAFEKEVS